MKILFYSIVVVISILIIIFIATFDFMSINLNARMELKKIYIQYTEIYICFIFFFFVSVNYFVSKKGKSFNQSILDALSILYITSLVGMIIYCATTPQLRITIPINNTWEFIKAVFSLQVVILIFEIIPIGIAAYFLNELFLTFNKNIWKK